MSAVRRKLGPTLALWFFYGLFVFRLLEWHTPSSLLLAGLLIVLAMAWLLRKPLFRGLRRGASAFWRRVRRKPNLVDVDLDKISWSDFEQLVGRLFSARGYSVSYTKRTADQGIDVIAENKTQRVGVQCKRYSNAVGNDAVMAAIAGSKFYQCNRTVVVCTSTFTRAAIELADKTGVELWDRKRLESELRWL